MDPRNPRLWPGQQLPDWVDPIYSTDRPFRWGGHVIVATAAPDKTDNRLIDVRGLEVPVVFALYLNTDPPLGGFPWAVTFGTQGGVIAFNFADGVHFPFGDSLFVDAPQNVPAGGANRTCIAFSAPSPGSPAGWTGI